MGLFRAQALLELTERFFTLNADGDDGEHLHPSDLAFVLETVMDQLRETKEILDRDGRLRQHRSAISGPILIVTIGAACGASGRVATHRERGLILRCARVLDGRPEIRGEIEPLLKKLEARIRPLPPRERPRATTPQTTSDMGDEMLC